MKQTRARSRSEMLWGSTHQRVGSRHFGALIIRRSLQVVPRSQHPLGPCHPIVSVGGFRDLAMMVTYEAQQYGADQEIAASLLRKHAHSVDGMRRCQTISPVVASKTAWPPGQKASALAAAGQSLHKSPKAQRLENGCPICVVLQSLGQFWMGRN